MVRCCYFPQRYEYANCQGVSQLEAQQGCGAASELLGVKCNSRWSGARPAFELHLFFYRHMAYVTHSCKFLFWQGVFDMLLCCNEFASKKKKHFLKHNAVVCVWIFAPQDSVLTKTVRDSQKSQECQLNPGRTEWADGILSQWCDPRLEKHTWAHRFWVKRLCTFTIKA